MNQIKSQVTEGFWKRWQTVNAESAIFHQWEELERSGCIDNFRILAENKALFRRGWYFADSDAYKWLEAATHILVSFPNPALENIADDFIDLLKDAQDPDGYLYTFNQIHFPGKRWTNLQIEHELYCLGHLIEAGVTDFIERGLDSLLTIACKAADRIVVDFMGRGPRFTPGHEEIEIALLRLYEVTGQQSYLDMAKQFIGKRGHQVLFALDILKQAISNNLRVQHVEKRQEAYDIAHPGNHTKRLPPENVAKKPPRIKWRWILNVLSGKFFQQHKPLTKQSIPAGHAVRFAYLQTAAAMLDRLNGQKTYQPTLAKSWERMVRCRMYVTGGIGSLPEIEGFGRDYELDPEVAYAETCAAIGSLYWNHEMAKLTGDARYSDLFEWQLYNAALVGMGLDGKTYLYNNPLISDGAIQRRQWYEVPCCPSNLSRTFARLTDEIVSIQSDEITIQQYISSSHHVPVAGRDVIFELQSGLPWRGNVRLMMVKAPGIPLKLKLRRPAWASDFHMTVNDQTVQNMTGTQKHSLDPTQASWIEIKRYWREGDILKLDFGLSVQFFAAHPKVTSVRGKAALTVGPLVYCLESCDNPEVDILNIVLDPSSVQTSFSPDILSGTRLITGESLDGEDLVFIPYHLWGNRGLSLMTVFVDVKQ
ncbi:MAG: glycoside hydrolase family 127 protein [Chloroflexota bacterium]|nr:glycoside hydrolase family 127 protein [Chloroflexota bacterium]